jgi:hypothetical protein
MPETTDYMILGYAITVIILLGLVVYLVLKARHLRAEYRMLMALEDDEDKSAATSGSSRQNLASR